MGFKDDLQNLGYFAARVLFFLLEPKKIMGFPMGGCRIAFWKMPMWLYDEFLILEMTAAQTRLRAMSGT